MRVIVTGGTGIIGSRLTAAMAADGHEVIVLSRSPERHQFPHGVRGEKWDSRTAAGWGHLMNGAGAVVNLAGENIGGDSLVPDRWTEEKKRRIKESRWEVGQALVQAVEQAETKPKVLYQASGVDYYAAGDEVKTEASAPGNSFLADVAANYWEPSTAAVEEMGVRRIIGRMGIVLDRQSGPLQRSLLQFKLFAGGRLGSGDQWWSWLHLDDAVNAIHYLIRHESASGPVNVATPNPVTNREYTEALADVMGRPKLLPVPSFALKIALGETAALVLDGRPVSAAKLESLGYRFRYPLIRPALADLIKN